MNIILQIVIFLLVSLSIAIGLFTALMAGREDLAYRQVFMWLISPVRFIAGMAITINNREFRRKYFQKLKSDLFIK
jgi:hypothetical protein